MKFIVVLSCFLAVALSSPTGVWQQVKSPMENPRYQEFLSKVYSQQNFNNNPLRGGRIVGGSRAAANQFPYQIYGYFDDAWLCGGSIISANYILTAAHCTYLVSYVDVYIGSIDRSARAPWETRVQSNNIIQHAAYNDDTIAYDISLIRTPAIPLNGANIGTISLPSRADASVNIDGFNAVVSGFGRFADNSQYTSTYLLYVDVPIINYSRCAQIFGSAFVNSNHVCVDAYGGRGSCGGDSGGPLTAVINGRRVQVGVVSFGAAAGCELGYPDVFTRVASYLDWISSNTGIAIN